MRVGSYVVIPGKSEGKRESFTIEKQLVDELYETHTGGGLFDDIFEDTSKLRDAARMSLECAGGLSTLTHEFGPKFLFLHGALVNPVSPYALDGFPEFTESAIKRLLPPSEHGREGRHRNFVSVYLCQLLELKKSGAIVCGVVERASTSAMVVLQLLDNLKGTEAVQATRTLKNSQRT